MKLYVMTCKVAEDHRMIGEEANFILLEGEEDKDCYLYCFSREHAFHTKEYYMGYWDSYMTHTLDNDTADEDICMYIYRPLEIGERFEDADHNVWERVE